MLYEAWCHRGRRVHTIRKLGEVLAFSFSVIYCSSSFMFRVSGAKLRSFGLVVFQAPLKEAIRRLLSLVINLLLPSFKFSGLRNVALNLPRC